MIVHPHGFARAAIAGLLLLAFYFHNYLSGAKSIFQSAFCDRKWAASEACETSDILYNAKNATSQDAAAETVYSIEDLVTNSTLGVNNLQHLPFWILV